MPWCQGCARFLNPNTLRSDGSCPSCEQKVADPPDPPAEPSSVQPGSDEPSPATSPMVATELSASATSMPKAPWHFKLLVVATVVYLGWRFVELIVVVAT